MSDDARRRPPGPRGPARGEPPTEVGGARPPSPNTARACQRAATSGAGRLRYPVAVMDLVERLRRESAARDALVARVRAALPDMVRVLVDRYGVRRVVLFGSVRTGRLSADPDVDLLVEGLAAAERGEAAGELFALSPLPVDLVRMEAARPEIVARALEEGEVLHGA